LVRVEVLKVLVFLAWLLLHTAATVDKN
jgi:hypothetical protein